MQRFVREAGCFVEFHTRFRRVTTRVGDQHPAQQVFLARHPQFDLVFAAEPSSTADMVGVQVRNKDACYRIAIRRF